MKKAMRKMIPAVIMLLISAMLVGTSTYAWFSMNKTVTVTGMTVKAKGSDNVMISPDMTEANFAYGLNQTRAANLEPASTIDGVNYFYTALENVLATGDARTDTYIAYDESAGTALDNTTNAGKAKYVADFNNKYGVSDPSISTVLYGYVDYSFYIKATNASDGTQTLGMSACNLLYNNAAYTWATEGNTKAWRIAVFAKETTAGNAVDDNDILTTADSNATLITILKPTGATNFTSGNAVKTTGALDTVVHNDVAANIGTIASGATKYYRVIVRLWLEGEDNTCKNDTFASLTKEWSLDLAFTLNSSAPGVSSIGSAATTTVTGADTATGTAALNVSGETAATYQWFATATGTNVTTDAAGNASYTKEETGTASYYCVITTQKGSKYRTATVNITVA